MYLKTKLNLHLYSRFRKEGRRSFLKSLITRWLIASNTPTFGAFLFYMLTLQELKEMKPSTVFASGEVENSPEGIFMTSHNVGKKLLWVAKRGGIHDWAIYTHWADKGIDYVISNGDKVTSKSNIKKLVPCDDEAFAMYRY